MQLVQAALQRGASAAGVVSEPALRAAGLELPYWGHEGSVILLALEHPVERPELDWWDGRGGTAGNRRLIKISKGLVGWLKDEHGVDAVDLPYHVERGGVLLKDAAVLAGLGRIGRNNLLLTPELGPRVRLRGLRLALDLEPSSPVGSDADPCADCDMPCVSACPQQALDDGYSRARCDLQMKADEADATTIRSPDGPPVVKYCRACELSCPLGR
jgi:epoxyqueuosine reductase